MKWAQIGIALVVGVGMVLSPSTGESKKKRRKSLASETEEPTVTETAPRSLEDDTAVEPKNTSTETESTLTEEQPESPSEAATVEPKEEGKIRLSWGKNNTHLRLKKTEKRVKKLEKENDKNDFFKKLFMSKKKKN